MLVGVFLDVLVKEEVLLVESIMSFDKKKRECDKSIPNSYEEKRV